MSYDKLISALDLFPLPSPPASRFSKTLTKEGPKWNAISNRNTPKLRFFVTHTKQSLAQFLIATFRAFTRRTAANFRTAHCPFPDPGLIAAKGGHRKLEICLTRFDSTTSKFLIDNFSRIVQTHSVAESKQDARSKKDRLFPFAPQCARTSSLQHLTSSLQNSNRHTYEKLEPELNHLLSAKVLVLIDTKPHFVQGILSVFELRSIMPSRNKRRAATGNSERH